MSHSARSPADAAIPGLLQQALRQFQAGDDAAQRDTLGLIGAERLDAVDTVVGALCLGGVAFADRLVAHVHGSLGPEDRLSLLLAAFHATVDAPPDAAADHEARVAASLCDRFGPEARPTQLLDLMRAEFLIAAGPIEEVPEAALSAMRHDRWDLALRGFTRICETMGAQTPRNVYGMAAMCLHRLGRYDEADRWIDQGLGEQRERLRIGPVPTEAELLRRWSGRRAPVVSIVCTTYNHVRYLGSAIRGFLSQDCDFPFEILIHDDASTDGAQQLIRDWQQRYPNVIKPLLQTRNQYSRGVRPFELLLARAQGEFVATCEGDDFWVDAGKLTRQVGFLKSHPEFSCTAHNYWHYLEAALTVRPWTRAGRDIVLSPRQLMSVSRVLWLPTLVFRKTFSVLPPERGQAAFGDQFLTSYLGTKGPCMYFETQCAAVRRENEFSIWSPLPAAEKERMRVKTWAALALMHARMGNRLAVADLRGRIAASPLDESSKTALLDDVSRLHDCTMTEA